MNDEALHDDQLIDTISEAIDELRLWAGGSNDARLIEHGTKARLLHEKLESMSDSWHTSHFVTKQIWKAHWDKPYRCPVCWSIPNLKKYHWWRIYTCPYGHRFSGIPIFRKEYR